MTKATIELFKVTKTCSIKFSLILDNKDQKYNQKIISRFVMDGNEYFKFTPFPFLTIDISTREDKNLGWNTNRIVNINRKELFFVCQKLKRFLSSFSSVKNLFYYDEYKNLLVNKQEAMRVREIVVCGQKTLMFQPCVVENEEDHQLYEGAFMFINTMDFYTYFTYTELEYLLYELQKIDFNSLSMQLISAVFIFSETEKKEIEKKKSPPVTEEKEIEINDKKVSIMIEEPHEIPDI